MAIIHCFLCHSSVSVPLNKSITTTTSQVLSIRSSGAGGGTITVITITAVTWSADSDPDLKTSIPYCHVIVFRDLPGLGPGMRFTF